MPPVREIKERGTYRFVLIRPDKPSVYPWEGGNFGEVYRSRDIAWPEWLPFLDPAKVMPHQRTYLPRADVEGEQRVAMAFITDPHLASFLGKLGWVNITDLWNRALAVLDAQQFAAQLTPGPVDLRPAAPVVGARSTPGRKRGEAAGEAS